MRSLATNRQIWHRLWLLGICFFLSSSVGCQSMMISHEPLPKSLVAYDLPKELDKATLPVYRVEPPDILTIDVIQNVSEADYPLHVGDSVMMTVLGTIPDEPIAGIYPIEAGGILQLGFGYGTVEVAGRTIAEAKEIVRNHLLDSLREPQVEMALRDVTGVQRIAGEHVVGPDGTITLGRYGSVPVVGLTLEEVRATIAAHLSDEFTDPDVSVSVFAFNSKVYYIVTQGAGLGDSLTRLPYTGNETVMDAISHVNGLSHVSSMKIWIARPGRNEVGANQILPIDWYGITQRGEVATNYQVLPGDRLYIAHDPMVAFDGAVAKFTAPLERIMGFTLLGTTTVSRLSGKVLNNQQTTLVTP